MYLVLLKQTSLVIFIEVLLGYNQWARCPLVEKVTFRYGGEFLSSMMVALLFL